MTTYSYADLVTMLCFASDDALDIADKALDRLSEDYTVTVSCYSVR